ncbi:MULTISPECIES: CdaR family protein [unclassified Bacillus (in: firmicutes)]|uniref:CdaR family protein n=1 Tax=unclassified Bacillus (in: firmicutes) TaxID=185979 RepID=UPI00232AAB5D|nr:CdaR family protein [Bacillus sp. BP-3]MDC2867099.1 CdaR family protein [Bacillus sp. BP-3]
MDKLMDNHWFLRGIALLLAIMLYMSTNIDKNVSDNFNPSPFPVGDTTETISGVPVSAYYDEDKYIVSGIPEKVSVTLEGQNNVVAAAKVKRQFEVFVNLRGYTPGTYEVPLKYSGVPNNLHLKVQPAKIQVTIKKKEVKSFPVEVKYLNENQVQKGTVIDKPIVKPGTVEVAGTTEQLSQIALVRAYVDLKGINKTVTKEAQIVLYDKDGNQLDLKTDSSTVNVTVPVSSPEKTVSLDVTKKGSLQEGITVTSIKVEPSEIEIYGSKDVLDNITSLEGIEVDLSKITESTTFDASVSLPKGVTKADPSQVKVTVEVRKQQRKTITDIPLQVNGLSDLLTMKFSDPQNGKISVDVSGDASIIEKISADQIKASINVGNMSAGTHDVPIQISGPNNVTLELKQKNAKVELAKKQDTGHEVQGQPEQPTNKGNEQEKRSE